MTGVFDLMSMQIGQPCVIRTMRGFVYYARITGRDGGIVHAETPGGSTIVTGCVWVHPIETDEDRAQLARFDREALPSRLHRFAADAYEAGP